MEFIHLGQKNFTCWILTPTWWLQPSNEFLHVRLQSLPRLDSDTLLFSLRFTQKHFHSILTLTQTNSWLTHTHLFSPNLTDGSHLEILPALNFFHLGFSHLSFPLRLLTLLKDWFPLFAQKNFTCSFWLHLIMAAILKSAILIQPFCTKKTFTHSFWLNLMMAAILNSAMFNLVSWWIQPF